MSQAVMMALLMTASGALSVVLGLWATQLLARRLSKAPPLVDDDACQPAAFLFRGRVLADATPAARAFLGALPGAGTEWDRLMAHLSGRLPGLRDRLASIEEDGRTEFSAPLAGGAMVHLVIQPMGGGMLRLHLSDPQAAGTGVVVDALSHHAMQQELVVLRDTVDHAPMLSWREDGSGQIDWANGAYLAHVDAADPIAGQWPLPRLFDLPKIPRGDILAPRRARLARGDNGHWFDCHGYATGSGAIYFALPADAAVRAERSLREFVQTLTKTFADLPIGLAIFDQNRNLQLFNPALIDLTGLATGFLTARPTLYAFLDRLREARMMPEPKDYRSWRQQMATLETAASKGHHVEVWSLPGGQIYRVTGRPHPDGAVAFLFEDITSEITLTRKFRAELSLGGNVLDGLPEAIVVFTATGRISLTNESYRRMWQADGEGSVAEALRQWQPEAGAGPGFQRLQGHLLDSAARVPADGAMAGPDGDLLFWQLRPLPGGARMVRFLGKDIETRTENGLPEPDTADEPATSEQVAVGY